ncbi:hypothetical protein LEP1GSC036_0958 [Leptospira weilii str. 2006001853]|uniref:Uncharacterized protein n=1 Tax=Leptospira weilii str. 2006001853 TaxID=1001589 RepID=A0A828Z1Z6_9LEPT|nr:hypothetical protein LEP1GSC036_0958 [Leptospira weilii str. 2006001853]
MVMMSIAGDGIFSLTNPGRRRRLEFGGKNMSLKRVSSRQKIGLLLQLILTHTSFKKRILNPIHGPEMIMFY